MDEVLQAGSAIITIAELDRYREIEKNTDKLYVEEAAVGFLATQFGLGRTWKKYSFTGVDKALEDVCAENAKLSERVKTITDEYDRLDARILS